MGRGEISQGLFERAIQNCGPEFMHVVSRWCQTQEPRFLELLGDWAFRQRMRCLDDGLPREAAMYSRIYQMSRHALASRCLSAA